MKIVELKDFKNDFDNIIKLAEHEELMVVKSGKTLFTTFPYEIVNKYNSENK